MVSIQSMKYSSSTVEVQTSSESKIDKKPSTNTEVATTVAAETYETSINQPTPKAQTYKPDLEKIKQMKDETDLRMLDLFKNTVTDGFFKQFSGLKNALEKILQGEKVEDLDISVTPESIEKAKVDIAAGGYYSAEATSDRFLDFAKALSGGDKTKGDQLLEAFKKGYEAAAEIWGGELPEISKKTYDMTLEKFDTWMNGSEE